MTKNEKRIRMISVILCEVFTIFTIGAMVTAREGNRLLMASATVLLILLPEIMERLFRCRLSLPVYLFAIFYAIGPMLGHCWNLYYMGIYWDKLLHIAGGVMFAIVGLYLFNFLNQRESPVLLQALFALCFSVAIAAVWEFVEFGADMLLQTDMQQDTLISAIHTYVLGDGMGVTGSVENIMSVIIDGVELPVSGYLDIGLIDTMEDMLVETLGAIVVFVVHLCTGGTKLLVVPAEKK